MEELRYENMYLKNLGHVLSLHVAQYVDKPFETFVAGAYPEKVDLLASHTGIPDEEHLALERCQFEKLRNLQKPTCWSMCRRPDR